VTCEVRPAEPGEAEALARLNLRTALAAYGHIFPPESPPPTHDELLAQWQHWLGPDHAHGRRGFVAVDDGDDGKEPEGVVLAGPDPDDRRVGHLARLYVAPERWGHGIGTQLYSAAVGSMVDAGFPAATLWVLEANTRARSWYERLGWELSGERKTLFAPAGIDDVGYRLDLGPLRQVRHVRQVRR
jgi:ribosomal protein S18 acetylase RimI-like enzyme